MIRPLGVFLRNCEISSINNRRRACSTRPPSSQQGIFRNARIMVELRYPLNALAFDYLRGVVGLGISILILEAIGTDTPVFWVFVGLAALFVVWLANTFLRHM